MCLNDTDLQLEEGTLDARAHEHFKYFRFRALLDGQLLSVIIRSCDIRRDFQKSLHHFKVFSIRVLQRDPHMLNCVVFLEVDGRQIVDGLTDKLVFDPSSVQNSDR